MLDDTGKAVLDDIYSQSDPRPYFRALKPLDYTIPKSAHNYFTMIGAHLQSARDKARLGIVDVGCSYGINGALLKLNIPYDELVDNYTASGVAGMEHHSLLKRDRDLFNGVHDQGPIITGVDISRPALQYALDAGFIDDRLEANLETEEITDMDRSHLAGKDLVVSTGCVGYVRGSTLCRLVDGIEGASDKPSGRGSKDARPWSAHFVLRMFSYDEVSNALAKRGYETIAISGLFRQRKFISFEEQAQIVDQLKAGEIDPSGLEAEGWFYAQLYVSIPQEDMADARPLIDELNALADG